MKHLIPHFIQEKFAAGERRGSIEAYTMFIDLSGFTPLTQSLMREESTGAEQLSLILNDIFEPLINLVYVRGGFIPYFAGDAFTAIFPVSDTGIRAQDVVQTAIRARSLFSEREYQFSDFTIGIKIGLSYGEVEWGVVGAKHKAYYFRGSAIDNCAISQIKAKDQDIVLDNTIYALLGDHTFGLEPVDLAFYRLLGGKPASLEPIPKAEYPAPKPEVVAHFLPKAVREVQTEGEFRTVVSVFISFQGIDTHELMDRFASLILDQINNFSGYFKEIDFGDKGAVMVGFFGAPITFENTTERALEFISAVREEVRKQNDVTLQSFRVGITFGTAYTGFVGGEQRCQYAAVGNHVNLAARLMTYADWGEILVDDDLRRNQSFKFLHKGDIKYKGIEGNIPTFKLIGKDFENQKSYIGKMIAREEELENTLDFAREVFAEGKGGVLSIFGEAGIGKSRLSFEIRHKLQDITDFQWLACQADQILRKPFNAFLYFLKNYFAQSSEEPIEYNRFNFESRLRLLEGHLEDLGTEEALRIRNELERTRTVLAALTGVHYTNSLWDLLDAKGRYQNTIAAVTNLFLAESLLQPLVVEIEDGHWLDDSSLELLQELMRKSINRPILIMITSRYRDEGEKPEFISNSLMNSPLKRMEVNLNLLSPEAVRAFAELKLGGPVSASFYELLLRTTNSNPFYLEQVLEYFSESELLLEEDGAWTIEDTNVKLSNSINAILTARIDRLSKLVKETVKAAAVIGREFEIPILSEVMKAQDDFNHDNPIALLHEQVKTAEKGQIWLAMNELRYIFRHSLLREAVYSMQLRTRLQQLHQLIAEAIERLYKDNLEERYVDLAFHYEQADDFDKTCEYLRKAADYARRNFQNQQALEYYEKLLKKLGRQPDRVDEISTYLKKGKVLELIGKWEACQQAYEIALQLAKKSRDVLLLGQANNSLGRLLMLRGDYQKASNYLQIAAGLSESIEDRIGMARAYGDMGNLNFRQGKYNEARSYFEQSIDLGYTETSMASSANIVANLGLTHMNQGNFDRGIEVMKKQLAVAQRGNDKQGMATLYTNLGIVFFEKGDYGNALSAYRKGLDLSQELGNKLLTSIAIGCIGSVYERQGDYDRAMEHFDQDLKICEELGDKQGIAIALGLIGELHSIKGNFHKAIEYLQKNLMLCEELGYKKGIAKAVNTLGDVFFYTQQYERSLHFYNRAIDIARSINNRLVLGASLVEKGAVLIEMKDEQELERVRKEALRIALDLGNPDLLFDAELLDARVTFLKGNTAEAIAILNKLLRGEFDPDQSANAYFERYRIDPTDEEARKKALDLYRKLYRSTPKFIFRHRIEMLES
ncbi:adenylate/guanylate cyclase domain-containing protein [Flavilitoribacter nigricans]|uniref:Adenylate/guanylate cyclase domain-containing protein n=1 Tax=Flavilitoribacter nigricans (strain ATCC 23147 / DSM 23189 / NBRC 102662 / NCIMB 1420 / SS-2) TaxID=1122177 RepID=A0A2D0NG36_FLAN2|nr:adenylate/guanylate cyclase domain-containing protein [Flavilitoribacter nigricans]PHN07437.1 adenylate/guanylate cyclase domain-containing protein [Flavilitoribacter nigricans DSM 23189 = NBRC 102662]